MEILKKIKVTLKSISPLIMHSDQGINPAHPLSVKMKEISGIRKKTLDHHKAMSRIEFELGLYWMEDLGVYIPCKVLMGAIKAAARMSKRGKETRGITIDAAIGIPIKGYEKSTPEQLWSITDKTGNQKHVFIEPVNVQRAKILRTRPIFPSWEITFDLYLDTETFNPNELKALIEKAGFECGIMECRPQRVTGNYGRFEVVEFKEMN